MYWKLEYLDEDPAKDKIVKYPGNDFEKLNFDLIEKKIREEEDKKTIQENKRQVNSKSVKAILNLPEYQPKQKQVELLGSEPPRV